MKNYWWMANNFVVDIAVDGQEVVWTGEMVRSLVTGVNAVGINGWEEMGRVCGICDGVSPSAMSHKWRDLMLSRAVVRVWNSKWVVSNPLERKVPLSRSSKC